MSKKILLSWLFMAILCLPVLAQIQEPVKFKTEWKSVSADEVEIVFTGKMEKGWHVYSTDLPEGGPISATFNTDKLEGAEVVGKLNLPVRKLTRWTRYSVCRFVSLKARLPLCRKSS